MTHSLINVILDELFVKIMTTNKSLASYISNARYKSRISDCIIYNKLTNSVSKRSERTIKIHTIKLHTYNP